MTFGLRQFASALVIAALATPVSLAHAAAGGNGTVPAAAPGIRASIEKAVQSVTAPLPSRGVSAPTFLTPAFPVTPKRDRSLKQMGGGGGGGMMIIGIIGTLAGLAGTYYLVKELKKSTDEAQKAAQ